MNDDEEAIGTALGLLRMAGTILRGRGADDVVRSIDEAIASAISTWPCCDEVELAGETACLVAAMPLDRHRGGEGGGLQ